MESVTLTPVTIAGIFVRTINQNQQAAVDIALLWQRFFTENVAAKLPNRISDDMYCVYTEFDGDFTQPYTTLIGFPVEGHHEIPEGMKSVQIEGGQYYKSTVKGRLSDGIVINEWNKIWQSDMHRTYKTDFELYPARSVNLDYAEIDIFVGLK